MNISLSRAFSRQRVAFCQLARIMITALVSTALASTPLVALSALFCVLVDAFGFTIHIRDYI